MDSETHVAYPLPRMSGSMTTKQIAKSCDVLHLDSILPSNIPGRLAGSGTIVFHFPSKLECMYESDVDSNPRRVQT